MAESTYLVVIPIDELRDRDHFPEGTSLPLHCTVMPWFRIGPEVNMRGIIPALAELSSFLPAPITLTGTGRDRFGPERDVPVTRVYEPLGLMALHAYLCGLVPPGDSVDGNRRWTGRNYRPHVSDASDGSSFAVGCTFEAKTIALVQRSDGYGMCCISLHPFAYAGS